MDEIGKLVNQHFMEWESRLKHVDELMDKADKVYEAREVNANASDGSEIQAERAKTKMARDQLAREFDSVRSLPTNELSNVAERVNGLTASFKTFGVQLEKMLTTVVGLD